MIPKSYRLTQREVEALFTKKLNEGRSTMQDRRQFHTASFFVVIEPSESFKGGVAVPKKVLPRAVDRNSLRRQVFDAIKEEGFFSLAVHMLLSVKKGTHNLSREEIHKEIAELYKKIKSTGKELSP
jgi:ribonuclease P protein component